MATILLGGGIAVIRGSIGGYVFSKNRSGAYIRNRTTPINPQSPLQSEIRAIISQVTALWTNSLSDAQRAAWAVFASNVPAKNKVGQVISLSGFNQFVKSNVVLINAGLATVLDAPIIFTLPGEDPLYASSVDAGTGKISVTFNEPLPWVSEDGAGLIVQMGIPVNEGITFFDGPWRHAGVIDGNNAVPPTSPDATIDVPFEVAAGQKVFTQAKIVRADGRVTGFFRDDSIVS